MNDLLAIAGHNTVAALVLSVLVYGLTRVWRHPPLAHVLWLVVLLKLVAPPVLRLDWPDASWPQAAGASGHDLAEPPQFDEPKLEQRARFGERPAAQGDVRVSVAGPSEHHATSAVRASFGDGRPALCWLWLAGSGLCAAIAATRIVRFERRLRDTLPGSERLHRLALAVAGRLDVRRAPDVRYIDSVDVPFVWWAGRRPTVVLPRRLAAQLDDNALLLILAHELAHLRRCDHWVRAIELIVSTIYWWNPLVWFVRRQIHEAEDLCCDAWVRWSFPDCNRRYAEVLLKAAESVGQSGVGKPLLPASPLFRSLSLKARIQMILEDRFAPFVSARWMFVLALLAAVVLPAFVQSAKTEARAGSTEEVPATPAQEPDASDFPYAVKFEQGATRFLDGDKITILEVHGTAETFTPGNRYRIRGEYTLKSHDRAMLAAYITAMDAENGRSTSLKIQSTVVDKGNGTFTLILPMSHRGWPHVSFYPAKGGEGFGGNYFGTGNNVLKRWWGSKDDQAAATACDTSFLAKRFKYRIDFETGRNQTQNGGRLEIREVWGTRPRIEVGGQYLVRGKYVMPSSKPGKLYFYATASGAWNETASLDLQSTPVDPGEGEFELVHGMAGPGYFHLILTDADDYSRWFANVYFGTGDNVYR
jgi:beta-lactamase regulating signal transducer with metallopeptidase domain